MRIFLCRHGQAESEPRSALLHVRDPPLCDVGRHQCGLCAELLSSLLQGGSIDAVYYSPLKRTSETMQLIMHDRPEPRICEPSLLISQGRCTKADIRSFVTDTIALAKREGFQNVLIVSHGVIIKYMVNSLLAVGDLDPNGLQIQSQPHTASVTEIEVGESRHRLVRYDERA